MIKLVIFDLDGTLTKFNLDISGIKREILGEDIEMSLMEIISRLKGEKRKKAERILIEHECEAALHSELNPGVSELFELLTKRGIKKALVTRNNKKAVEIISKKHGLDFDVVITREDGEPKPSGKQLELVLNHLELNKDEAVFVGDHRYDLDAGRAVGITTGLIRSRFSEDVIGEADFYVDSIDELIPLILSKEA